MITIFKKHDTPKWLAKTGSNMGLVEPWLIPYLVGGDSTPIVNGAYLVPVGKESVEYSSLEDTKKLMETVMSKASVSVPVYQRVLSGNVDIYKSIGEMSEVDDFDFLYNLMGEIELADPVFKAKDPNTPEGLVTITQALFKAWDSLLDVTDAEYASYWLRSVSGVKWDSVSEEQIAAEITKLSEYIPPSVASTTTKLKESASDELTPIDTETRSKMQEDGLDIKDGDPAAVEFLVNQAIAYFPTSFVKQSAHIAKRLQNYLVQGVASGARLEDIVNKYVEDMEQNASKVRKNWLRLAAHSAVTRARSRAMLGGFYEAGIERVVVFAVLDERTTPICEFLDGQTIAIRPLYQKWVELEENGTPLDEAFPMFQVSKDGDITQQGEVVASPSSGSMEWVHVMDFGFPPYHFFCRSTVVYQ